MNVPGNQEWDRLSGIEIEIPPEMESTEGERISPSLIVAAGLADLVLILALTTGLVLSVIFQSFPCRPSVLYWALPVAILWWLMAAMICLRVLKAGPGMVIAGLAFASELKGPRLLATLLTLLVGAAFLGLPLPLGGSRSSLLSRVAGFSLLKRSFA